MALVPPTSPSWTWIRLIKACSLLLQILLKSTLAHVSWRSPLKASLNFLALSLVSGPTRTSNGSFDGWIASILVNELIPYTTQPHERTNSLKHKLVSELIRWSIVSSANWFPRPHNLVRELIHWSIDLLWNWFDAPHNLVWELIRCTTQPCQGTDSLKHILVRELICWRTDSLANWFDAL